MVLDLPSPGPASVAVAIRRRSCASSPSAGARPGYRPATMASRSAADTPPTRPLRRITRRSTPDGSRSTVTCHRQQQGGLQCAPDAVDGLLPLGVVRDRERLPEQVVLRSDVSQQRLDGLVVPVQRGERDGGVRQRVMVTRGTDSVAGFVYTASITAREIRTSAAARRQVIDAWTARRGRVRPRTDWHPGPGGGRG